MSPSTVWAGFHCPGTHPSTTAHPRSFSFSTTSFQAEGGGLAKTSCGKSRQPSHLDPWPDALDSSCFEPVSASKGSSAAQLQERSPGFQYEPFQCWCGSTPCLWNSHQLCGVRYSSLCSQQFRHSKKETDSQEHQGCAIASSSTSEI